MGPGWTRGTLHLVRAERGLSVAADADNSAAADLVPASPPPGGGGHQRTGEKAVKTIERPSKEGPLTRGQLRERLDRGTTAHRGQALIHLLFLAAVRGSIVRGPMVGKRARLRARRATGSGPQPVDRDGALAELARRYLVGHGPATDRDLARWAGLPLRDARAGLAAIAPELRRAGGRPRRPRQAPASGGLPAPRLLGAFDPVLLGWTSREGSGRPPHKLLVSSNGLFRPFALVKGRAVATWGLTRGR